MWKKVMTWVLGLCTSWTVNGQKAGQADLKVTQTANQTYAVAFTLSGENVLQSPAEGLWSVATDWQNDWMSAWVHGSPTQKENVNGWTILTGKLPIGQGEMLVRDAYRLEENGLIHGIRRYQWAGKDTLHKASLSVRFQWRDGGLKPFMPGILYYGNPAGAKVNDKIIPVYTSQPGEFAIFEDHRYPMPFCMLEQAGKLKAAALHTVPSPVQGARLADQWWSMGVETYADRTEFVLYSGPIGYNRQHSVAKALQHQPMKYTDTYLDMEPGRIVEKEFYIQVYPIGQEGSGFEQPLYTALEMYQPFDADAFTPFDEIIRAKYHFAQTRWLDEGDVKGFGMYEKSYRKDIVMGWCGQAGSLGYALQCLDKELNDPKITDYVQQSLDFLATYPVKEDGMFPVGYFLDKKEYHGGDPVSCGQAMYNIAKAIEVARKSGKYNTSQWETFLKKACDGQATRILKADWRPYSTAEGFLIAPLILSHQLFGKEAYKEAAVKAASVFAERHLTMREPYWGGTLDATCEDKEGAWAAFQGFASLYEALKEEKYLAWAKHAMDVCLSYTVVWDIPLPPGRMADHLFRTTGWTVVSPQNQHIDIYGVMFTPEVYKMGIWLNNESLKKLAKVMYRSCFQLTNPYGSQGEQLQQTNFAQHGDMSNVHKLRGGYSESWTVFWITAHFLNAGARFAEMNVRP